MTVNKKTKILAMEMDEIGQPSYDLIWKKEVLDNFETYAEAEAMMREYCLAYNDLNIKIEEVYE